MTEKAKLFSAVHNSILAIEHNGSSWAADSWKGPNLTSRVLVFVPVPARRWKRRVPLADLTSRDGNKWRRTMITFDSCSKF